MEKVQKIKVFSFAKFQAILLTFVGLVCGILYSVGGFMIDLLVTVGVFSSGFMSTSGLGFGTVLAFGALIGMPIIFAIFGYILGIIESILFNFFVKYIGGVKMDFFK